MTNVPSSDSADDLPKDPGLPRGTVVGEYVLEKKIGEGAFGSVYSAEHPVIGKRAAIKVLSKRFSSDDEVVSRFVSEARAVNRIRHRNIVDIFAFGQLENGQHYLIMEFLEGQTLRDFIESRGVVSVEDAMPVLRGVADALDAAHDQGIVHRDLKPDNVFLARERKSEVIPKLLDFGVAKLQRDNSAHKTATGIAVGTPLYMSPEQCRGRSIDHRSDIYAFGAMVYEMLTGQPPFDGETVMDIMVKHMNEPAQAMSRIAPHLPRELDDPVLIMLAKKAAARPASAGLALASLVEAARKAGSTVPKYEPAISSRVMEIIQSEGARSPNANVETKRIQTPALGSGAPTATLVADPRAEPAEIELPMNAPDLGDLAIAATRAATPQRPIPAIGATQNADRLSTDPASTGSRPLDVGLATPHMLPARRTAAATMDARPARSTPPDSNSRKHMTLAAVEAPTGDRSASLPLRIGVAVVAIAAGVAAVWGIKAAVKQPDSVAADARSAEPTTKRVEPTYQPAVTVGDAAPTNPVTPATATSSAPSAEPSASARPAASASSAPTAGPRTPPVVKPPPTAKPTGDGMSSWP